jgi:uncharacterized protein YqeY
MIFAHASSTKNQLGNVNVKQLLLLSVNIVAYATKHYPLNFTKSFMSLKAQISEDMKNAMRAKDSARLGAIRLLQAAIKQREVDERIELSDTDVIAAIEKMLKQRRDSIAAYESANRQDLADVEKFEVTVLQAYLPQQLTEEELNAILEQVVVDTGASGIKDMSKVMAAIKPLVVGRADMGKISGLIKTRLG